jgi:hypothetical protein
VDVLRVDLARLQPLGADVHRERLGLLVEHSSACACTPELFSAVKSVV